MWYSTVVSFAGPKYAAFQLHFQSLGVAHHVLWNFYFMHLARWIYFPFPVVQTSHMFLFHTVTSCYMQCSFPAVQTSHMFTFHTVTSCHMQCSFPAVQTSHMFTFPTVTSCHMQCSFPVVLTNHMFTCSVLLWHNTPYCQCIIIHDQFMCWNAYYWWVEWTHLVVSTDQFFYIIYTLLSLSVDTANSNFMCIQISCMYAYDAYVFDLLTFTTNAV